MIPTSFEYVRAKNLNEALKLMGKSAKVIAGGHSLLPLLKFRLAQPETLIDIGRLAQLKGIKKAGRGVKIGAATTYRELLESRELKALFPLIAEVTEHIGDVQVRNAGTIGGGLAHADPAADMPPVMLVLDATFVLQSKSAKRSVPARKFFKGPFTTALKPNELLTEIQLPAPPTGAGMAYASFDQAASGYPLAGAAAVIAVAKGMITRAELAFTGLADTPFLAPAAAKLVGTSGDELISHVGAAAVAGVAANDDIHAGAAYRTHLATVAARRALTQALARAGAA
ncbi:MAG TPA: xanthine dehydrogenase family protein subunit M [Gemmatimonadales bacterium]|nr:xanthine dehydrogenase family protein subunit M [Gemmatimonadales bacterium]